MSPLRLNGSISGYSEIEAPANAGSEIFTLPGTGGTLVTSANAGKILQVVSETYSAYTSIISTSYTDTGLSASITPSSDSNKVLVLVQQPAFVYGGAAVGYGNQVNAGVRLLRDSSVLIAPLVDSGGIYTMMIAASGTLAHTTILNYKYLDSPATTSSVTYKTQAAKGTTGMGAIDLNSSGGTSSIILMEVAA